MTFPTLYLDLGQSSLKVFNGTEEKEFAMERETDGRLTAACRERVRAELREFLPRSGSHGLARAWCALGARGVSLRRVTMPPVAKDAFHSVLRLQIEKEFPLSPDELAWGCCDVSATGRVTGVEAGGRELLVVAVKKDGVEDYEQWLVSCGIEPVFTLGAFAGSALCPDLSAASAVLDIGKFHSELLAFEEAQGVTLHSLAAGGEDFTRAIAQALSMSRDEAERLKCAFDAARPASSERDGQLQQAAANPVRELATVLQSRWRGKTLYLIGGGARFSGLAAQLTAALDGVECVCVPVTAGRGRSSVIAGLQQWAQRGMRSPPLTLQTGSRAARSHTGLQPDVKKWAALAAVLALTLFLSRYLEAWLKKPGLEKRMAEIRAVQAKLPEIDRELGFLQFLETNQPPYLAVLAVVSDSAARGTSITSVSLNRRGELSLKASMQSGEQATDLRKKLIDSGYFSSVVVEEQTPSQDRKVTVRMSAQWKPSKELRAGTPKKAAALLTTNAPSATNLSQKAKS